MSDNPQDIPSLIGEIIGASNAQFMALLAYTWIALEEGREFNEETIHYILDNAEECMPEGKQANIIEELRRQLFPNE